MLPEPAAVLIPAYAFNASLAAIAAIMAALDELDVPLDEQIRGDVWQFAAAAVQLAPQHLHDLAQRAPALAMPYEVWQPMLAAGLRLQEERDRARDCAVALEQELAAYDEQHKAAAP